MFMFGTGVKIDLFSSLFPAEAVEIATTKWELKRILRNVVSNYEQRDNHVSKKKKKKSKFLII